MGNKYEILCAEYPFCGWWQKAIRTDSVISFIFKLIWAYFKYEIIDVKIRRFD